MAIRTHLGRSIDATLGPNLVLIGITLAVAVASVVSWLGGAGPGVLLAPAHAFVLWTLIREVEPDQEWAALVGAGLVGVWAVRGSPTMSLLVLGVVMISGRIVSETTGRRPLVSDLAVVAVSGIGVAFTPIGWIAGFGLAVALYIDDRLSEESRIVQVAAAVTTAVGATLVAALTGAFPDTLPSIVAHLAIPAGVLALLLVVREPPEPVTRADARHRRELRTERIHASRSLVSIAVFAMVMTAGEDADRLTPALGALALVLIAAELERARRLDR